jgi:hypothetical protein
MPRRSGATTGQRLGRLDQRLPDARRLRPFGDQEARSGNRGVRQTAHQFRVVLATELPVGRRPRPVIDEVAVRMALDVQGQQTDDGAALVAGHQMDEPSSPTQGAAAPCRSTIARKSALRKGWPAGQSRVQASPGMALAEDLLLTEMFDGKSGSGIME